MWKFRRNKRPQIKNINSKGLIQAGLDNPEEFKDRNIYIAVHHTFALDEADQIYAKNLAKSEDKEWGFYEDWNELTNGATLISVYYVTRRKVQIDGLYETPKVAVILTPDTEDNYKKSQYKVML
ncbi:hypothetical protein FE394_16135 [Xenorhabdus sp. Reich]|uniref:Uncharacterized protein n=1 Tax=Xenorhabdus littoralis TaxID=2582835 RepID=A0ABU4SPT3_9GAMM|nr:hypothetical protein [Xenorhabdus sp. Reich]MDX8000675.1 hypothetical protein [Xenorhabdus sp. Reich]